MKVIECIAGGIVGILTVLAVNVVIDKAEYYIAEKRYSKRKDS